MSRPSPGDALWCLMYLISGVACTALWWFLCVRFDAQGIAVIGVALGVYCLALPLIILTLLMVAALVAAAMVGVDVALRGRL